jgi:hypothetical protein
MCLQYLSLAFRGLYCNCASLKGLPEFTARLHVFAKCIADDDEPDEFGIHCNSTILSFLVYCTSSSYPGLEFRILETIGSVIHAR